MSSKSYLFFILTFITFLVHTGCKPKEKEQPFNVLFIMADDLRPQLKCYGDSLVKSPNIDGLANQSLVFNRAYCQSAVCSPSRNSLLSGLRPNTTGLHGFGTHLREVVQDVITLPQQFKNNGYDARAFGKIFHIYDESMLGNENDSLSWSKPQQLPTVPVWGPTQNALRNQLIEVDKANGVVYKHPHDWPRAKTWDNSDIPDDKMQDGNITSMAIEYLESVKKSDQPFFLAVGFFRPHLPFVSPKKYWDFYDIDSISLPKFREIPRNAPDWSITQGIVENYYGMPAFEDMDTIFLKKYLHAYLACISYVDACVGRLLRALEETGKSENTIIVFLGDHGYQMGEYNSWGHKHSNFEISTRAPLIVHSPNMLTRGIKTNEIVEFLDIYPTLCDLTNLPVPTRIEGESFANLLFDKNGKHKGFAISEKTRKGKMGKSIRTDDYRFTEWRDRNTDELVTRELYDHKGDIGNNFLEVENIYSEDEQLIEELRQRLKLGLQSRIN